MTVHDHTFVGRLWQFNSSIPLADQLLFLEEDDPWSDDETEEVANDPIMQRRAK